jgi:hypothetical protein
VIYDDHYLIHKNANVKFIVLKSFVIRKYIHIKLESITLVQPSRWSGSLDLSRKARAKTGTRLAVLRKSGQMWTQMGVTKGKESLCFGNCGMLCVVTKYDEFILLHIPHLSKDGPPS